MKPMLLCRDNPDTSTLPYPVCAFPKLDGIRCVIIDGKPKSRTLKDIPNLHIQKQLSGMQLDGLDGELIIGSPTSPSVYRDTNSVVMSHDKISDFTYYIFDVQNPQLKFYSRLEYINSNPVFNSGPCKVLEGVLCNTEYDLIEYEEKCLNDGYEGVIIRCPDGMYREGRTTMKEQNTYKLKRFIDGEAKVVGYEEEMYNGNIAETNELGRTKRSTAKAGLSGKGSLGALVVQDCITGIEFNVGSGYDAATRQSLWDIRDNGLLGKIIKYKHFPIGVKIAPRHPIFLGFRDPIDM